MKLSPASKEAFADALARTGQRTTRQREEIFSVILDKRDHPTADEIFARARRDMPTISLATVYNCLETLVEAGLVRQVNFDREPSRYCPNQHEHAHFQCRRTGRVVDIDLPDGLVDQLKAALPEGYSVRHIELAFTGETPATDDAEAESSETRRT